MSGTILTRVFKTRKELYRINGKILRLEKLMSAAFHRDIKEEHIPTSASRPSWWYYNHRFSGDDRNYGPNMIRISSRYSSMNRELRNTMDILNSIEAMPHSNSDLIHYEAYILLRKYQDQDKYLDEEGEVSEHISLLDILTEAISKGVDMEADSVWES